MDNIVRELFIGLLAAVIGGLIVGRLERRLAAVSSWYRVRTDTSRAKREGVVTVLAANPQLLAVAYLDALVGVVFLTAALAAFLQLKNMIEAPPLLLGGVAVPMSQPWTGTLLLTLMALIVIIAGYFVSRRISVAQEAWRKLGQANGLPKFW